MGTKQGFDIVGGGFSGLMQAFYLAEAGYPVRLFETSDRLGGLLGSKQQEGFLIEQAANAFIANQELERVAHTIGVPLISKKPQARKRYIYHQGSMSRWPLSFKESLRVGHFVYQWKWNKKNIGPEAKESLYDWGLRCLGPGVTEKLLEPAMQGVYACRSRFLNASLIVESLSKKSPRGRLSGSVAPLKGMQQWIDGVVDFLKQHKVEIVFDDYFSSHRDRPVIFALGLKALKQYADKEALDLPQKLLNTQTVSLSTLFLGFNKKTSFQPEGFGCLFPEKENFKALGVLFNHSIFPGRVEQGSSETWILNDEKKAFSEMDPSELLESIQDDRWKLAGVKDIPSFVSCHQWPRRIPLYDHHLRDFIEDYESQKTDFLLMGNFLGDLGLSKILNVARKNVEKIEGGYFG